MAEFEKSVSFKNWTTDDFQGVFAAAIVSPMTSATENHSAELILDKPYLFKAGGTYSVPSSQAMHFAKQLAVRELHKIGTAKAEMLSEPDVREYMNRCFPASNPLEGNTTVNSFERIDEIKDVDAKAAEPMPENKTENDAQTQSSDDDDDNADDDKNNAGTPKFKSPIQTKDAAYVK